VATGVRGTGLARSVPVEIHRIQGIAFSSYLIETPSSLFLVDSGFKWFEPLVLRKIRQLGRKVDDIALALLTHPHLDHVGALPALRDRTEFEIAAHPDSIAELASGGRAFSPPRQAWTQGVRWLAKAGLPLLRLPAITPTLTPSDGERLDRFGLPGAVHYTPGHSRWCISLVLDEGTAFAGDLIIGPGHMTRSVCPPAMAADPHAAIASMRKLLSAGAKRFMPAHGRAFDAVDVAALVERAGA